MDANSRAGFEADIGRTTDEAGRHLQEVRVEAD